MLFARRIASVTDPYTASSRCLKEFGLNSLGEQLVYTFRDVPVICATVLVNSHYLEHGHASYNEVLTEPEIGRITAFAESRDTELSNNHQVRSPRGPLTL